MEIDFTQYLLPDGRTTEIKIDRPDDIAAIANKVLETGRYRFECEMLTTGMVSFTCLDIEEEVDIAIELSINDKSVLGAVDKLIQDSHIIINKKKGLLNGIT